MDEIIRRARAALPLMLMTGMLVGQVSVAFAHDPGQAGDNRPANGCGGACHSGGTAGTTVAFGMGTGSLPTSVAANSVNTFTFKISGGPASNAGLSVTASAGTLAPTTADSTVGTLGELFHNAAAPMVAGSKTYTFTWTAPAVSGPVTFAGAGVSGNAGGSRLLDGEARVTGSVNVTGGTNVAPIARITGPATGTVGAAVSFDGSTSTDADGSIATYLWNFGDNTAGATATPPPHTYATAGTFTVTLAVTDNLGLTSTPVTHPIVISAVGTHQPPVVKAGGPYTGTVGTAVVFNGSASTVDTGLVASYSWNFGDNSALATVANPSHTYLTAGTFPVTLKVTDNAAIPLSTTVTTNATISAGTNVAPIARITGPTTGTVGAAVSFDGSTSTDADGSIATYLWNFGDNTAGATATPPPHTYATAGTFTVTLAVTDNLGLASTPVTHPIVISAVGTHQPPVAKAGGPYTGTVGTAVVFSGSTSTVDTGLVASYSWNFGDNSALATVANPSHTYLTAGTFPVTLKVTDNAAIPLSTTVTTNATISAVTPPTGKALYVANCESCHGPKAGPEGPAKSVVGESAGDISNAIIKVLTMQSLSTLSDAQVSAIATYLKKVSKGEQLYIDNCESCHGVGGAGGSDPAVIGASKKLITTEINTEPEMASLKFLLTQDGAIEAIAKFLEREGDDLSAKNNATAAGALDWLTLMGVGAWGLNRRRKK